MKKNLLLAMIITFMASFVATKKQQVIQIDVSSILNARPVTVLSNGRLFTWTKGIDGNGAGDGYLTMSAALFNGDKHPHALPDNAWFSANAVHPEIVLHYSNNDTASNQARFVSGEGRFEFKVPANKYSGMFVCLTSAEGASQLEFELTYADGTETKNFILPDYYNDLAENDPNVMYVAHDLAKWDNKNKMTETDHHNIDAINIHPNGERVLTAIKVKKDKAGYLIFWAATGVIAE